MSIDRRQKLSWLTVIILTGLLLGAAIPFNISYANSPYLETLPNETAIDLLDEYKAANPQILPEWTPSMVVPEFDNQVIIYNSITREETTLPIPTENLLDTQQSQSFYPAPNESERVLINGNGMTGSTAWRYSPIIKVSSTFPSGVTVSCSGILVDSKHVLTAAHCVYTYDSTRCNPPDSACWAESVRVKTSSGPDGQSFASSQTGGELMTWSAWTISANYNYDLAGIELAYPIGGATGWHALGYADSDEYYTSNTFTSLSYQKDYSAKDETRPTWSGAFSQVFNDQLDYDQYSYAGQSGSGVFDSNMTVLGVLSHGTADPEFPDPYTAHTRITADKFAAFTNWFAQNTPDLFDLAIFGITVSPETFDPSAPITALDYYLFNVSSVDQAPTTYTIDFYLSPDETITPADIHLYTQTSVWSFDPKAGEHITLSANLPAIPDDLCVGDTDGAWYYLGAILDFADADPANNITDADQSARIWINACDNN